MSCILQRLNVDVDVNCNTINLERGDTEGVENEQNVINGTRVSTVLIFNLDWSRILFKIFSYFGRTNANSRVYITHKYSRQSIE